MELELLSQYSVMCVSLFVNMRVKLGQNKRQETNRSIKVEEHFARD